MNIQRAIVAAVLLMVIGGSASAAWWYWSRDTGPQRVSELKAELLTQSADKEVSERRLQRTSESLMREFDQLKPEQRKAAQEELRAEAHERLLSAAREWQQLPEEERGEFLDVQEEEQRQGWEGVVSSG